MPQKIDSPTQQYAAFAAALAESVEPDGFPFTKRVIGMHTHQLSEEAEAKSISFQTMSTAADYDIYLPYEQKLVHFFLRLSAVSPLFLFNKARTTWKPFRSLPQLIDVVTRGTRETAEYIIYAESWQVLLTDGFDVASVVFSLGELSPETESAISITAQASGLYML